ncbi:MAG: S-adenosylmethionine decarboxylase [Candidatus Omnitrophota bacterium]
MTTKQNSANDEQVSDAGVRLATEPAYAAATFLPKVKKVFSESSNKTVSLKIYGNDPFLNTMDKQPEVYLKRRRKSREMKKTVFGYELVLDLSGCDVEVMSSKKKLTEYVNTLCKLIDMKKYGEVHLPYFGLEKPHTKGYSLLQFIETSSITGHFSEYWRKSYINIFSCKPYDRVLATKFTKEFFKAAKIKARFLTR